MVRIIPKALSQSEAAALLSKDYSSVDVNLVNSFASVANVNGPAIFREADVISAIGSHYQERLSKTNIAFATVTAPVATRYGHTGGQYVILDQQALCEKSQRRRITIRRDAHI